MTAHGGALGGVSSSAKRVPALIPLGLIPLAIVAAGWLLQPLWAWVAIMGLLAVFTVLVGRHVVGGWKGAFIDDRNMISLSRFQTVLWTLLVVAGFLAAALYNIRSGQPDPLSIAVPAQLWALLGISVTSLAGSALIKGQQSTQEVANKAAAKKKLNKKVLEPLTGTNQLVDEHGTPVVDGVLPVNATPDKSNWSDMFRAEQVGSNGKLDLGKIQMFYFTIILVIAYAVAIATMLRDASGKIAEFPALENGIVALLGISSATYLANKSIPRTEINHEGQDPPKTP